MPRVDIHMDSPIQPDVIRQALLDFTPHRLETWPGIDPAQYQVIEVHDTWADIREGSKMPGGAIWAVEHYDWSDPETVVWTVRESNFSTPGSFVSATITPRPEGGSHIHVIWNREGANLKGKVMAQMIKLSRGAPVAVSMKKGLANMTTSQPVSA